MIKDLVCKVCQNKFDLEERKPYSFYCCGENICKQCCVIQKQKKIAKCVNCKTEINLDYNKMKPSNLIIKCISEQILCEEHQDKIQKIFGCKKCEIDGKIIGQDEIFEDLNKIQESFKKQIAKYQKTMDDLEILQKGVKINELYKLRQTLIDQFSDLQLDDVQFFDNKINLILQDQQRQENLDELNQQIQQQSQIIEQNKEIKQNQIDEINNLQIQLKSYQNQIFDKESKEAKLQSQLNIYMDDSSNQLNSFQATIQNLEIEQENLQYQIKQQQFEFQQQNDLWQNKKQQLKSQIQDYKSEIENLNIQLQEQKQEISDQNNKILDLYQQIENNKIEQQILNDQIDKNNEQINDIADDCYKLKETLNQSEKIVQLQIEQLQDQKLEMDYLLKSREDIELLNWDSYQLLKQWLDVKDLKIKLIFKGTRDSFESRVFHQKCDNQQNIIFLVRSKEFIFGGYQQPKLTVNDDYIDYFGQSFLFSITKRTKHPCINQKYEIYAHQHYLFAFGDGHDLKINDFANQNEYSYSNLGHAYQLPQNIKKNSIQAKQYFTQQAGFSVDQLEVLLIIN